MNKRQRKKRAKDQYRRRGQAQTNPPHYLQLVPVIRESAPLSALVLGA